MTIREQLRVTLGTGDAPTGSSWIARLIWALIDLDEPGLIQLDRDVAAVLWPNNWPADAVPPPDYPGESHTISRMLGDEEMAGNPTAKAICDLLAVFLGANHCVQAQNLKD